MLTRSATIDNVPEFIAGGEGRQGPADGLRAPRLQELRPRAKIIKKTATTCSRSPARTRCSTSPSSSRRSRSRRLLHQPQALPERRLLLRASSTRRWASRRDVHRAVRDPAHGRLASDRGRAGADAVAEVSARTPHSTGRQHARRTAYAARRSVTSRTSSAFGCSVSSEANKASSALPEGGEVAVGRPSPRTSALQLAQRDQVRGADVLGGSRIATGSSIPRTPSNVLNRGTRAPGGCHGTVDLVSALQVTVAADLHQPPAPRLSRRPRARSAISDDGVGSPALRAPHRR
jgi:predicted secreted protein